MYIGRFAQAAESGDLCGHLFKKSAKILSTGKSRLSKTKMATKKKRAADNYLTHDNWDQEDDNEEPEVILCNNLILSK